MPLVISNDDDDDNTAPKTKAAAALLPPPRVPPPLPPSRPVAEDIANKAAGIEAACEADKAAQADKPKDDALARNGADGDATALFRSLSTTPFDRLLAASDHSPPLYSLFRWTRFYRCGVEACAEGTTLSLPSCGPMLAPLVIR